MGRSGGVLGRIVAMVTGVVGALVVLGAGPSLSPASAQSAGPFPVLSADEIVTFLDRVELPGTVPVGGAPAITGDPGADGRIIGRAQATDYRLRRQSAVALTGAAGVPLNPEAADALNRMRGAAASAGAAFTPVSGFRSFDDQRGIFLRELAARGAGRIGRAYTNGEIAAGLADAAIDDVLRLNSIPGFSYHHTGDTVDLTAPGGSLGAFEGTPAYRWLSADNYANAKAYGFLPSYPVGAGAIGPEPEPWEFTYVGSGRIQCARNVVALSGGGPGRCPVGSLDSVVARGTRVEFSGWAADPDAGPSPAAVHVYADGVGVAVLQANTPRPDVDAATGLGPAHGFAGAADLAPGVHVVCAYAINDAPGEPNALLGCQRVVVATTPPIGSLDRVQAAGNGVIVEGWSADPDVPGATLEVHAYVDGRGVAVLTAGGARPDVDAVTGLGGQHGFSARVPVPTGVHQLCLYGISPQPGEGNRLLACRSVWSLGSSPTGVLDLAVGDGRSIVLAGWAVDGDLPDAPLDVHVYVDGVGTAVVRADGPRPDVGTTFAVGATHGFGVRIPATVGPHLVCAYAIAAQPGDGNALVGCQRVAVAGRPPVGALDAADAVPGGIRVAGWSADPDVPATALDVHVYVDGAGAAVLRADGERPDVAVATPYGGAHGYDVVVAAAPGRHVVCAYGITPDAGEGNATMGCRTVDVTA